MYDTWKEIAIATLTFSFISCTFFSARWGGQTRLDFFFLCVCTASTLYSDKTPLCSLIKKVLNPETLSECCSSRLNMAVKLP